MELLFLILSSLIFFIFLLHGGDLYRKRRLPPGPIGLPIIGNLFDIVGPKPHISLAKLAEKHGPLMTIRLGSITSVVASSPDAARDVLQRYDEACSSRPVPHAVSAYKHPDAALLWIPPNETWRSMRKVLNLYLTGPKQLDTLNNVREDVVEGLVEFLRRKNAAVDIGLMAFAVSLNQLSQLFFSYNVTSYESQDVKRFKTAVDTAVEVQGKFNLADIFPVLKPIDPQNVRRQATAAFRWLEDMMDDIVDKRLKHRESKLPRFGDVLDSLLDYSHDNHEADIGLKHIKALLADLLVAGTESFANTTTWIMSIFLLHPEMLLKVRKEVSQIIGKDGKIEEAKTLDLPYLNAVINETIRLYAGSPLLAPHMTGTEVKIDDYVIPKNTQIFVNVWAISRDPRYWENPLEFMPERFLDNKVDFKGQHFEFVPFGSGRRKCPGMPLGHRMLSLIAASLVYHFDWKLPYPKEEMDMNNIYGLTLVKATPLVATPIPLK